MRIYVASSWKNALQVRAVCDYLREQGHTVYDFTEQHFNWVNLAPELPSLDDTKWYVHPLVLKHYTEDREAIDNCDLLVAIMPAGNSTHMELGIAIGEDKTTVTVGDRTRDLLYLATTAHYVDIMEFFHEHLGYAWEKCREYNPIYEHWFELSKTKEDWLDAGKDREWKQRRGT
jgi:nucleoside 2-deoxyribosyltransferase